MHGATNQRGARCALANGQQFPANIDVALEIPSDGTKLKGVWRKPGEHGDCAKAVGGRRVASDINEWERELANGITPPLHSGESFCRETNRDLVFLVRHSKFSLGAKLLLGKVI